MRRAPGTPGIPGRGNIAAMANHKRRRPKHQRAGCLLCKPHKDERAGKTGAQKASVRRKVQPEE
jgi:hypothetical protein